MNSIDKFTFFRQLHEGGNADSPLVLPNAWDAMSACVMELAGAKAIGTTSGGASWSLGFPDGECVSREMMMDVVGRIVAAVGVPVTADIESGYGSGSPEEVAETVRMVIAAGAVGINLEDSPGTSGQPLLDISNQCRRLEAVRRVAEHEEVELFVNARIDTYLFEIDDQADRLEDTISRALAYSSAGADGFFVPGVVAPELIEELVDAVDSPLNIMATPGVPSVSELKRLGVRRVSVGTGIAQGVMASVRSTVEQILESGDFTGLSEALSFAQANELFREKQALA